MCGCSSGHEAMELRQRAPSDRLDHDEPFSDRLLPSVESWGWGAEGGGVSAGRSPHPAQSSCDPQQLAGQGPAHATGTCSSLVALGPPQAPGRGCWPGVQSGLDSAPWQPQGKLLWAPVPAQLWSGCTGITGKARARLHARGYRSHGPPQQAQPPDPAGGTHCRSNPGHTLPFQKLHQPAPRAPAHATEVAHRLLPTARQSLGPWPRAGAWPHCSLAGTSRVPVPRGAFAVDLGSQPSQGSVEGMQAQPACPVAPSPLPSSAQAQPKHQAGHKPAPWSSSLLYTESAGSASGLHEGQSLGSQPLRPQSPPWRCWQPPPTAQLRGTAAILREGSSSAALTQCRP